VTDIYAADIQSTRPVEGVRIDDKLYIATGTYPVYYQGDGKIYVFELLLELGNSYAKLKEIKHFSS
jgi:hypothetical protein